MGSSGGRQRAGATDTRVVFNAQQPVDEQEIASQRPQACSCHSTCLLSATPPSACLPADWDARQEDPANQRLWEQDWDDDNTNDDFSQRLKAELAKQAAAAAPK